MQPIWRPYTQHQRSAAPLCIESGKGALLQTTCGRQILDLVSSWWVNVHGHCHPSIADAIAAQAKQLEHVIFAGFTHRPAEKFADALLDKMGEPYSHVFFSDNGSTAVEVALKMALQEAINQGAPQRRKLLAFEGGFHGDTWAAMSVSRTSGFFGSIAPLLADNVVFAPYPATWHDDAGVADKERRALAQLDVLLDDHDSELAALIIEPLIQGASGMRMVRPQWLAEAIEKARSRGLRIIFDEVMTGFGRTGKLFAYEHLPSTARPDIVCLSKGITGGFLPLAATVARREIYDAFLGESFAQALVHGHSYTANPLACAAALASLQLFDEEATLDRIAAQAEVHRRVLPGLPGTSHHRALGAVAACEIDAQESGYSSQGSLDLRERFLKAGLLVRPLGNSFYMLPPACLSPSELEQAYERVSAVLEQL